MPVVDPRRRPSPHWPVLVALIVSVAFMMCATPAWSTSLGQDALDRGTEFYRHGRFTEAIEAFQAATQLDPGLLKAWENLGWAYRRLGKDDDAIRVWETVLKIEPDTVGVINEIGAIHVERKDWDRAKARYDESLRRHSDQPVILFRLAGIHQTLGHRAEASRYYHAAELGYLRALDSDSSDADVLSDLGWATRKQGKPRQAIAAWGKALALNPKLDSLYKHLADATLEIGDAASARVWYSKAWRAGPRVPQIAYRLADLAFQAQEDDQALWWIARLFQFSSADAEWSLRVANLFLRNDRSDQGKLWFESRLEQTRHKNEINRALSRIHAFEADQAYQGDRIDDAIEHYHRALEYDPTAASALRGLGWAYWAAGRWEQCREVWTRYAKAYPNRPEPFNLLTRVHLAQKAYPAAIQTAQTSLNLSPDQPSERLKLAKALFGDRQFDKAKRNTAALAKEYPEDVAIQTFWGELLIQYHDDRAGEPQWRKVLSLGPPSPRARYYWLRSLYGLGQYDKALGAAQASLIHDGPQLALLQLLIEDALAREDPAEAVRWYEQAVRQFPERPALWTELAALYRERGMLEASNATLAEARLRHPDQLDILITLADNHRLGQRYDDAAREYRALFARYPHNRKMFIGLFNTLVESNRGQEALDLLEHNRATFLTDYDLQMQTARVLLAQGQTAAARALLTKVASPETPYVPILLYHGLGDHPRSESLPVALFESQLKALRDAGYTAVTVRDLARMIEGRQPFPAQPIVITFDDARRDSFQLGDPLLAKYRMNATMFVPTARIVDGHPFFADWDLIRQYVGTGRWDLQAHGHQAHDPISIDEAGQLGGFLVNRQWLEAEARLETQQEYADRLEHDYQETIRLLTRNVPGLEVVGYAFPFSEAGQETIGNEPAAADFNERFLFRSFRYGFVQDQIGYNEVGSTAPTMLRRLNVPRSWDGQKLLKHLATRHPRHSAQMQLGKSWRWSGRYEQSRAAFQTLAATTPLLWGESEYQLAGVAFDQGRFQEAQRHLETAFAHGERSSEGQRLMTHLQWENEPRADARIGTFHDSNGRANQWSTLRVRYPFTGPVTLWTDVGVIHFGRMGCRICQAERSASAPNGVAHAGWLFVPSFVIDSSIGARTA